MIGLKMHGMKRACESLLRSYLNTFPCVAVIGVRQCGKTTFAITAELRIRGVDVLTAQTDNATQLDDAPLLDRATELGRVLFSQDEDLLKLACERQRTDTAFAGLIYAHQLKVSIGGCVEDLELIATRTEPRCLRRSESGRRDAARACEGRREFYI